MSIKNTTHPVYVKRGATDPHNYKATNITASDKARLYIQRNNMYGRTIVDVLNDIKLAKQLKIAKMS